ncbi:MAG: hypothetical protein IT343_09745 [Candidatus Melainabacteria bacterium]|jgi:hypothetical protein|nr:hypothetical protein [Candidatus Melainabacteria bacterium]
MKISSLSPNQFQKPPQNLQYKPVEPGDNGPLKRKTPHQNLTGDPHQTNCALAQRSENFDGKSLCRGSKQRVRALSELLMELPDGAVREVLSECLLAIINGEGDIKYLRALTMRATRQLRTMYLSGGQKALAADTRWRVRQFAWESFAIHLYIGPKGLHLDEGQPASELNAFIIIDSNGSVWAGETYAEASEGPVTLPLTTEDVFQRLSEKLLMTVY